MAAPQSIQALLLLQDDPKLLVKELEVVTTPQKDPPVAPAGRRESTNGVSTEGIQIDALWTVDNDDGVQYDFKSSPLPDTQPKCPDVIREKAWDDRFVIGNN